MKNFADLILAIASLLWPLTIAVALFYYRKEIRILLQRIKRGKFLGQEVELRESLDSLEKSALTAAAEVPLLPLPINEIQPNNAEPKLIPLGPYDPVAEVLITSKMNPAIGLMMLSDLIDRELREIIYSQGEVDHPQVFTLSNSLKILEQRSHLAPSMMQALREFHNVKASIIHEKDRVTDAEILRAIDSGLKILETLQSIHRGVYFVHKHDVKVYSDRECTQLRPDVRGVILAMGSPKGSQAYHIYPTTRTDYRKDMQVAWEWSSENSWGQTWYRDTDTNEIMLAWSDAMEFVGRPLYNT
jgi:hypothetical protein